MLFKKALFIFIWKEDWQRRVFHALVYSPSAQQGWSWTSPKLRAWSFLWSFSQDWTIYLKVGDWKWAKQKPSIHWFTKPDASLSSSTWVAGVQTLGCLLSLNCGHSFLCALLSHTWSHASAWGPHHLPLGFSGSGLRSCFCYFFRLWACSWIARGTAVLPVPHC